MSNFSSRTLSDVDKMIEHAKMSPSDLLPHSQVLHFDSTQLDQNSVKLLEVDKALADALEAGDSLVFRGEAEDGVVLCTADKTYDVKEAETSNSLLMLDGLMLPKEIKADCDRDVSHRAIMGIFHTYLEIKELKPKMRRLNMLLEAEEGKYPGGTGFPIANLLERIQCSEKQLRASLADLGAIEVGGKWFKLEADYKMKVLSLISNYIEENSWPLNRVNREDTVNELAELENKEVVREIFDLYHCVNDDGRQGHTLDTGAVSRFYGEYLLQTSGNAFNLSEFLTMWQQAVPEGVQTDVKHLRGLSLVDDSKTPNVIKYFPEWKLTENIQDRLVVLFALREKWTLEELEPYVEKLTTTKLNANALLTKFSRVSKINGVKHFSSKHGK